MYIRTLLFSALALSSFALLAAPQPDSVTNEVDTEGGELRITIQGQGFGSGPDVAFFHDFRGLEDGQRINETKPMAGNLPSGFGDREVGSYLNQNGFWVIDESDDGIVYLRVNLGEQYQDVFLAYSVAIPEGRTSPAQTDLEAWGGSTWKFAWLLEEDGAHGGDSGFDLVLPTQVGDRALLSGNASKFNRVGSGAAWPFAKMSEWWSWGKYNHISGWVSANEENPSQSSGAFNVFNEEFGMLYRDNNSFDQDLEFTGPQISVSQINFPGWVRNTGDDNFQAIYANIYVAGGENMLARIELTDSENYTKSSFRKVLLPSLWGEEKIESDVNIDIFRHQGPLYLHVFNAEGERSKKGILACQKCPVVKGM